MKNKGQHHSEYRNYAGVIANKKAPVKVSDQQKKIGKIRNKVDDFIENRGDSDDMGWYL